MKELIQTVALFLGYGMLIGCTILFLLFLPEMYRYLRDDMRYERLFWLRRRAMRWYRRRQDQIIGFLVVLAGLAMVYLGLIISAPAQ